MPKKPKSMRDYAEALANKGRAPYTHLVRASSGVQFSIHKSPEAAEAVATRMNGTVEPYAPVPSTYWTTALGSRYDH